uniref:Secretory carrier-associated membrane protein n=1 Tax=Esox lucius TaxID=8010 RepID=A0AAY5LAH1_ESOLU
MSGFDQNPFVDPVDVNPFQDASVTQITKGGIETVEEFNPFTASAMVNYSGSTIPISNTSQPAVLQASVVEPTPQETAAAAQANLLRQQEELEKKAAELDRKEKDLQNRPGGPATKENNWPRFPKFSPIKPCFYQDFDEDIPEEYQKICKRMYYLWIFHSVTLFLNLLACLAYFTVDTSAGVDFGLSILWLVLFTPVSFLCWYRPVYKAFRSDSSFSFFFFFFVFFFQVGVYIIQCVGIPRWGNRVCKLMNTTVHSKYRRTGASFSKAQQEFSSGVLTNQTFQSATATAASSAAQGVFQGH